MRTQENTREPAVRRMQRGRFRRSKGVTILGLSVACALFLGGCAGSGDLASGYLPRDTNGGEITNQTGRVTSLWVGTWIAALAVGLIVWGLTVYVMVRFRRRKTDVGLPPQLRYNVPLEMLYTIVPVFMVAVLFYYTARDESSIVDVSQHPDLVVNVVAKQWAWDFNYVTANTYETGVQTDLDPSNGVARNGFPVLYLPEGKRVEFQLTSRDVIHSFWVPAFLQKMDVIPGRVNRFQIVPTQEGTFTGKCAELCGAYHSQMFFTVKVVSPAEYDAQMAALRAAGQSGQLPNTLNRSSIVPADQDLLSTPGSD